jgi:hypothetical protein
MRLMTSALLVGMGLCLMPTPVHAQTCTTTLSVGGNIATAVAAAANDTTICLNDGDYETVDLFNITARTGFVTIRSTTEAGATLFPRVGNSRYIRFDQVTLNGALVNSCSLNIEFINTPFVVNGLYMDGSSCPSTTHNYLVDGATFTQIGTATYEGRLSCRDCNGAIVRNSTFTGIGATASDGIQTAGTVQNFTIGPNNRFSGFIQEDCGATHCDAIQLQGGGATLITSNVFEDSDTFIMSPDGCTDVTTEHNIFNGAGVVYPDKIQFGSCANLIFRHNTLTDVRVSMDSTGEGADSSNALAENNIMRGTTTSFKTSGGAGCTGCTFRYNLFDDAGDASGTNNVIGTPSFVGGSTPSTWAGWQLASGSPGENAGNDGADMGSIYLTSASLPARPTGIRKP